MEGRPPSRRYRREHDRRLIAGWQPTVPVDAEVKLTRLPQCSRMSLDQGR
jgi:hypothetical protein